MDDLLEAVPILRIFDVAKAKEFYVGYLGFTLDWEHRFEPSLPLYAQVSRGAVRLHLSEHHGAARPAPASWSPSATPARSTRSCTHATTTCCGRASSTRSGVSWSL